MPGAPEFGLPSNFWFFVTRLGEAQLLLPTALAIGAWFAIAGARRSATLWLSLFTLAFGLTMASKVAFIGWGVGIERLDFTGVSGHAMHAAAVLPLLLRCFMASRGRAPQGLALVAGVALAGLVALSRVATGTHSASESMAGFALGSAAAGLTLALGELPQRPLPRWLVGVLLAAQLLNPMAAPSLRTHDAVTRVALWISGHERPFTRSLLHQRGASLGPTAPGLSCS